MANNKAAREELKEIADNGPRGGTHAPMSGNRILDPDGPTRATYSEATGMVYSNGEEADEIGRPTPTVSKRKKRRGSSITRTVKYV